jgi:hypothetical protein
MKAKTVVATGATSSIGEAVLALARMGARIASSPATNGGRGDAHHARSAGRLRPPPRVYPVTLRMVQKSLARFVLIRYS